MGVESQTLPRLRGVVPALLLLLLGTTSAALASDPRRCASLMVGGVSVPKETLSLMLKAGQSGNELYFMAFAGITDDGPRLVVVMGEDVEISPRGRQLRDLILKQFGTVAFGGGSRGTVSADAVMHDMDEGFDPGTLLETPAEGWQSLRTLDAVSTLPFADRDRAHHMVRSVLGLSGPQASLTLAVVADNYIPDMIDEFSRQGFQWTELPGQMAAISGDGQ